jgi:LacI family transcriptional regulator
MRATIRQVAGAAGVSAMTVSRILRGQTEHVAPETAEKVLRVAREFNYIAVRPALQNKRVTTHVISLVVDGIQSLKSTVGAATFDGLRDAAMHNGYDLLLHAERQDVLSREEARFLDRRSDGVIFVSPRQRRKLLQTLAQHEFPTVACYSVDVPKGVATITPDNVALVKFAVEHLWSRAHRKIAFFAGPSWHSDARERQRMWTREMKHRGAGLCATWFEASEGDANSHRAAAEKLLQHRPTAVLCHNDYRALILWQVAREQGIRVPKELSIIGVDDIPAAQTQGLTTFSNPFEAIGTAAVEAMIGLLRGEDAASMSRRFPVDFVERHSVDKAI